MKIKIAGIEPESIVDGTGIRYAIFVQGCPHHCDGCHNPETWDAGQGRLAEIDDLVEQFLSNELLDGITLTGGEPFMQPDACLCLAQAAKRNGLTVWCYSGFTYEEIKASKNYAEKELLKVIDVLVDGRFVLEKKSLDLEFRGSANQRILHLDNGRIVSADGGN